MNGCEVQTRQRPIVRTITPTSSSIRSTSSRSARSTCKSATSTRTKRRSTIIIIVILTTQSSTSRLLLLLSHPSFLTGHDQSKDNQRQGSNSSNSTQGRSRDVRVTSTLVGSVVVVPARGGRETGQLRAVG